MNKHYHRLVIIHDLVARGAQMKLLFIRRQAPYCQSIDLLAAAHAAL